MTTSETTPTETSLLTRTVRRLRPLLGYRNRPPVSEELPVTHAFELLANYRRQLILEELAATERTPVSTSTLAERVACAEYNHRSRDELEADQRKRVYISLTQSHLEKLSDTPIEVISYSHEENLVDRGPEFDRVWEIYTGACQSLSPE